MAKIKYLGNPVIGDVYKGVVTIAKNQIADVEDAEAERLINTFGKETFKLMKPMLKETIRTNTDTATPKTKETVRGKTKKLVKK